MKIILFLSALVAIAATQVQAQNSLVISFDDEALLELINALLESNNVTAEIEENLECQQLPYPCDQNASCNDTDYSYTCTCNSGYYDLTEGNETAANCTDVDECTVQSSVLTDITNKLQEWSDACAGTSGSGDTGSGDTGSCGPTASDISTFVSYLASNYDAYNVVTSDANSLTEQFASTIDASTIGQLVGYLPCDAASSCANDAGTYNCSCDAGFSGYGVEQCLDVDECAADATICDEQATCTNTFGSYLCTCNAGYTGDGTPANCADVDECADAATCDPNATCANTVGSHTCTCNSGFEGDGQVGNCADIDECTRSDFPHNCSEYATCSNLIGGFSCACDHGFAGDGETCDDVDECAAGGACDSNADCVNTIGNFTCTCHDGYEGNGLPDNCIDIDECLHTEVTHDCHVDAICGNLIGTFECTCNGGYSGNGTYCFNVDECADPSTCDERATCEDTEGSFVCQCNHGYFGDGRPGNCADIDECLDENSCDPNADCDNTDGSYTCACRDGYAGNGTTCDDVDECGDAYAALAEIQVQLVDWSLAYDLCQADNDATAVGSGSGSSGFVDCSRSLADIQTFVDDISARYTPLNLVPASENSLTQLYGSFATGSDALAKLSELASFLQCDLASTCDNTEGSYECRCRSGFSGDGSQCLDDDECLLNTTCDARASCTNEVGGFECSCDPGYHGDGHPGNCTDINECINEDHPHDCHPDAECINTDGDFRCSCLPGFTGDGDNCVDLDECSVEHDCALNAVCHNSAGGYECECNPGTTGDGRVCFDDLDRCLISGLPFCDNSSSCSSSSESESSGSSSSSSSSGSSCSNSVSCSYAHNNPNQAQLVFDYYRSFFHVPSAVEEDQCGITTDLLNPVSSDATVLDASGDVDASGDISVTTTLPSTDTTFTTSAPPSRRRRASAVQQTLGICPSTFQWTHRNRAFRDELATDEVELFHFGGYFQWFAVGQCSDPTDRTSPISCVQRYLPRKALTIQEQNGKYLVSQQWVFIESGCEVDIFLN